MQVPIVDHHQHVTPEVVASLAAVRMGEAMRSNVSPSTVID
jgi:hypothetical protein